MQSLHTPDVKWLQSHQIRAADYTRCYNLHDGCTRQCRGQSYHSLHILRLLYRQVFCNGMVHPCQRAAMSRHQKSASSSSE